MHKNLAFCHLFARVLAADGIMEDRERTMLYDLMNEMELNEEERDQVKHFEKTKGAEETIAALPEEERRILLSLLWKAAWADGQLQQHEMQAVQEIAQAIHLGKEPPTSS